MTKQDLLDLQNSIIDAKSRISELKGKQSYLLTQLKEQFNCNTIEEANTKVKGLDKKLEKLTTQINENTKELEEKYGLTEE